MPKAAVALWLALAAAPAHSQPAAPPAGSDQYDARLTEVKGEVTLYASDEMEGVPAEKDTPLEPGDRVTTGPDASAEIGLDGTHVISLGASSDFTLESPKRSDSILKLALGSLLAKIQSLAAGQGLRVRTPTAVAAVRGTEFGVDIPAETPDETHVGVFDEGRVEVQGGEGAPELLKSNQETSVRRGQRPLAAYQLRRFVRHRRFMRTFRKRAAALRQRWKALPPEKRRELRRNRFELMRERRQNLRQERRKAQQGRKPRKPVRKREDQEKMEKRREEIRRRRGR